MSEEEDRLKSLVAWLLAGWSDLHYQEIEGSLKQCPHCGTGPHEPDCRINEAEGFEKCATCGVDKVGVVLGRRDIVLRYTPSTRKGEGDTTPWCALYEHPQRGIVSTYGSDPNEAVLKLVSGL